MGEKQEMGNIESIKEIINELESNKGKLISEYTDKMESAKEKEAAACRAADAAYRKSNPNEYHKQQELMKISKDAAAMYESKLKEIEQNPLISQSDFDSYVNSIHAELEEAVKEDGVRVAALVSELIEIRNNEEALISDTNNFIEHMQKDLLKDPCGLRTRNGDYIPQERKVKKYRNLDLIYFVNLVREHPYISALVNQEPKQQPKKPIWVN